MTRSDSTGERSLALFLLGVVAFTPPLMTIFSTEGSWLGIPVLYLYIFAAWAALILLMGLSAARGSDRATPPMPPPPATDED